MADKNVEIVSNGNNHSYSSAPQVTQNPAFRLDPNGFITNLDHEGKILVDDYEEHHHDPVPSFVEAKKNASREIKWQAMFEQWDTFLTKRKKKLIRRSRKGIPDTKRIQAWKRMAKIDQKIDKHPLQYQSLLRESCDPELLQEKSFKNLQDTIERDIHRTFPRHSMFYDNKRHEENSSDYNMDCINGIMDDDGELTTDEILHGTGGQAALRRVLKAFSVYDKDIGYCQGMNFIAGLFLTRLTEEESFWMLVSVMKEPPCRMGALFEEGMKQTHEVLYIAEKLVHQFLPKLARHFEKEHIQVNMFVTQWLLTQYSSSFHFDLVLRVWDAFLAEGWKISYRIMLAILLESQNDLLALSFEDILAYLRELPDRVSGRAILDRATRIPLKTAHIQKYEREWKKKQK